MQKTIGILLLVIGASGAALAPVGGVPEINAASGGSALALLAGTLLVIRGRRRK